MVWCSIMRIGIIGAGFSGLAVASVLHAQGIPRENIVIFEKNENIGGLIQTYQDDGRTLESGPQAFRGTARNMSRFLELTGLKQEAIPSQSSVKWRYILHEGKLKKLPTGPLSALTTSLISFRSKLRVLKEPFVKKLAEDKEESIAEFVARRFGKGLDHVVDAFVTGVYGGSHQRLSMDHAFPQVKQLERMKGSVVRGALYMARQARKQRRKNESKKHQGKKNEKAFLYTFKNGLKQAIESLARNFDIQRSCEVTNIDVTGDDKGFLITTREGQETVDKLVIAVNPNALRDVQLFGKTPEIKINEARIVNVYLGYQRDQFRKPPTGYGFLVPSTENRFVLGVQYVSDIFPHLAPENEVLLRCFIGGVRNPEAVDLSEKELVERSIQEMTDILSSQGEPTFKKVIRTAGGIPQIELGHAKVLKLKTFLENNYGVHVTGVGWTGISTDHLAGEAFNIASVIMNSKT